MKQTLKLLKDKAGMTLVELVVALTILMIIIMSFTPMLLKSYEWLYVAGEENEKTYKTKSFMENSLAVREDDASYDLILEFADVTNNIAIRAKQIAGEIEGLATLYGSPRKFIQILSGDSNSDNYDEKALLLRFVNFSESQVVIGDENKAKKADDNAGIPVISIEVTEAVSGKTVNSTIKTRENDGITVKESDPFAVLNLNNNDITSSPIRIIVYYYNEYDKLKNSETLYEITPADIMLVGNNKSGVSYYSTAGADENGNLMVVARKMESEINSNMNDVTWVGTDVDNTFGEGYYIMCGDNSTVRRLWHLTGETGASRTNIFDSGTDSRNLGGINYYKYKWIGDYADTLNYGENNGSGSIATNFSNSITHNKYSDDSSKISSKLCFNGYATGNSNATENSVRISYIQKGSESEAEKYGYKKVKGLHVAVTKDIKRLSVNKSGFNTYNPSADSRTLGTRRGYFFFDTSAKKWYRYGTYGLFGTGGFDPDDIKCMYDGYNTWVDDTNAMGIGSCDFSSRNVIGSAPSWGESGMDTSCNNESQIAYLYLKSYNNCNTSSLTSASKVANVSTNAVNLTSCAPLPGSSGETLYFGYNPAYAIIGQSDGASILGDSKTGTSAGYVITGNNGSTSNQMKASQMTVGAKNVNPFNSSANNYGANFENTYIGAQFIKAVYTSGNLTNMTVNKTETTENYKFTIGYCSQFGKIFANLSANGTKPFENIYFASKTNHDDDTKNVWLNREFLTTVASDVYNQSVVAVGYTMSGYSDIMYSQTFQMGDLADYIKDNKDFLLLFYMLGLNSSTGTMNIPDPNDDSNKVVCTYNKKEYKVSDFWHKSYKANTCYFQAPGMGEKKHYLIQFQTDTSPSTQLTKLVNDGVISVYNPGDSGFSYIYYYRNPDKTSVRFNSVAVGYNTDNVVNAYVGTSAGKVITVPVTYSNNKLQTTAVSSASCKDVTLENCSCVNAIEANNDIIIAGGETTGGTKIYISTDKGNTFSTLTLNSNNYTVKDITISNNYVYVVGGDGTNGVIFYVSLDDISTVESWKCVTKYCKSVSYNNMAEVISVDTMSASKEDVVSLPMLNAIASKNA